MNRCGGRWWQTLLSCAVVAALGPAEAIGGKLDDFERSATEKSDDSGDSDHDHDYDHVSDDEGDAAAIVFLTAVALPIYGASQSWARVHGGTGFADKAPAPRLAGEAMIPFVRVDPAYQLVESDVDAWDLRGEVGYGPFALQARATHYDEDQPRDDLDLVQAHALLRSSFFDMLEVDLGVGGLVVSGADDASGFSGTVPVLFHPWNVLGLEFRPAWAAVNDNFVGDYDLSLLAGWRFVSLRAGYRWTESGSSSLNGPIFGLAARW